MMSLRKELQAVGIKLSVNDFIIKIAGNALSKCPTINVVWEGSSVSFHAAVFKNTYM